MFNQFTKASEKGGNDYSIYLASLAFRDKTVENRFRNSYFTSNLQLGRACHLIAILFIGMVGMWNVLVVDPSGLGTWIGAYSSVTLIFLLGLTSAYFTPNTYARYWQPLFAFYMLVTGTAVTFVTLVAPPIFRPSILPASSLVFCSAMPLSV